MAIAMTAVIPDATTDMYDELNREMGISSGNLPEGLIAHYAAWTGEGMLIYDVWDSKDDFERFAAEQLAPAMEKVTGGQGTGIKPSYGDVYNEFHR
jgi:hypothetical protein